MAPGVRDGGVAGEGDEVDGGPVSVIRVEPDEIARRVISEVTSAAAVESDVDEDPERLEIGVAGLIVVGESYDTAGGVSGGWSHGRWIRKRRGSARDLMEAAGGPAGV